MIDLVHFEPRMNEYLFGCVVLLAFWLATWIALRLTGRQDQIPEFLWASTACAALGVTEPLFVPEYWDPPSVLKVGRWDLESFLFCFAVGGIAAVVTELPSIKRTLVRTYFEIERLMRGVLFILAYLTRGAVRVRILDAPPQSRLISPEQTRVENMLLVTFFAAVFGATSQFNLNIIYDAAFVCVATAFLVAWRRPRLRWQILGGGITFTVIYGVALMIMDHRYPTFYEDYWVLSALSGIWLLGAPIEEYVFAFTFGVLWAPLYEAWKET